ncbi:MAG: ABC transporter substrate-binding protein [Clostridiales bacterium]|nr:ABC transporter substrate-binding protein [Clostridiales bacterium]
MKKVLAMVLALLLVASFGAAHGEAKTYKVGFSNVWVGNSWGVQCVNELESFLKNNEQVSEYFITNADNDVNKQISDIEDLIAKGVDLLILQPITPEAVSAVIEEAFDRGIVVVTCASALATDSYHASVVARDYDFGRVGAEWLVEKMGGKGKVICLDGMAGLTVAVNRMKGATDVFAQYPEIEIIATVNADWDYAKGRIAAENLLAAYPQIDGVWSSGGDMTRGCIEAFVEAGRPLIPMMGEDNNGFLKLWAKYMDQGYQGIATSMPTWLFAEGAAIGLEILNGTYAGEKDIVVDIPIITQDTVLDFVRQDLSDSFWNNTRMPEEDIQALYGGDRDGTQGF